MDVLTLLSLASLACGSGVIGYAFRHVATHREIEVRLKNGDGGFTEINGKLQGMDARMARTETALKELLVHHGLRKPGQGINGKD